MKLFLLNLGMVFGGAFSTVAAKFLSLDTNANTFHHPIVMTFVMFIGESILLIPYYSFLREIKNEAPRLYLAIPALCDFGGSLLNFVGLIYLNASAYQILKTLSMVFCILLSTRLLSKQYSNLQYCSVVVVILGLLIVSLPNAESDEALHY